jgi:hypothetical protein
MRMNVMINLSQHKTTKSILPSVVFLPSAPSHPVKTLTKENILPETTQNNAVQQHFFFPT